MSLVLNFLPYAKFQVLQSVKKENNLELNHQIYKLFDANFTGALQSYYNTVFEKDLELKKQSNKLQKILDGQNNFTILTDSTSTIGK